MKSDFPILSNTNVVYLDNSATTQKPSKVITSIVEYYEHSNANIHRGIHKLSQIATQQYEEARETVANFIKAKPEEIIFTKGTTESLNLLARSLGKKLQKGDEIVLSEMEHHSNIVPWQQIAKETGAIIKYIPVEGYKLVNAKDYITNKTKIVSLVHMSNVLGTINPVKELAELAHEVGAIFIVDAAQSVPHMRVDVKDLDCDFLAFSGHKMLAPTGVGVLFGKKELLESLDPFQFGGGMIKEVTIDVTTFADVPEKFEAGTPMIAQAIGLANAIDYLESIGMENVKKHCDEITDYALEKLSTIEGLKIIGPKENRGAVISFTLEGLHPHDISEILDRYNVAVRAGNHCTMILHNKLNVQGTTRASFYVYNTKEDADKLVEALEKAKEVFK